jgi:hypothetical protein
MENFSPDRYIQYKWATAQRRVRLAARGDKTARHEVAKFVRNAAIFATAVTAAATAAYDYRAHANGEEGLTQHFGWGWVAASYENCTIYATGVSQRVQSGDKVAVSVEARVDEAIQQGSLLSVSGPLGMEADVVCFESEELPLARIIFQSRNGDILGKEEIYVPAQP